MKQDAAAPPASLGGKDERAGRQQPGRVPTSSKLAPATAKNLDREAALLAWIEDARKLLLVA
ncbi:hypothetical protein ART_3409 [Arthrobacter sp. PAMC 25486]|nr:hypothetical protein ART_3409 [Arthrobacter sp. PAMC 25486]